MRRTPRPPRCARSRSRTVGVIVPDITDPAYPPIIRGIEDALARHGYVAILANTDGDARRQERIVETMRARAVDGLILATVARDDPDVARLTAGLPVVTVVRACENPRFSSVVHDEEDGMRRILTAPRLVRPSPVAAIAGPQGSRPASAAIGRSKRTASDSASAGRGRTRSSPTPSTRRKASAAPRS